MKTQLKFMIEEFDIIFERVVNGEQPDVPDVQETPPSNFLLENQRREDEETWPRPLPDLLDSDEDDYHDDQIVYAYESPVEEDNCEPDSTTDL
ncbi:hypothetical protein RRG08_010845 [Elysia crispata]|uniref:Uncharacterized protein n=1 Tax=Elysia crispata TaxID=231223 RepID=A0AAE1CLC7_9GAST|nr:hypothetical protein RRG08_010845 [Elysia crispata]